VAYVFCYRTMEGRDIISKWWVSLQETYPALWGCSESQETPERAALNASGRSNQSDGNKNSTCNGNDLVTEITNMNDIQQDSQL